MSSIRFMAEEVRAPRPAITRPIAPGRPWVIVQSDHRGIVRRPCGVFLAAELDLVMRYADLLWPRLHGRINHVIPADGACPVERYQAREKCEVWDLDRAYRHAIERRAEHALEDLTAGRPLTRRVVCALCGCDELHACCAREGEPCWWAAPELCSVCCERAGVDPIARAGVELMVAESRRGCVPQCGGAI